MKQRADRYCDTCMTGKIIKGIAGFYYVAVAGSGVYACKAKGIFRKERQKPLVGDLVRIDVLDEQEREANLTDILPRKNALIRPAVANVDQAMILFALREPDPDGMLLDRFLVTMEQQGIPVILCFNKTDLAGREEVRRWKDIYAAAGYEVLAIRALEEEGAEIVRQHLEGRTTVVAGPSGAGKSTLTNALLRTAHMETGALSEKLRRGKNTTRHAELVPLGPETFFCDTPGFTALEMPYMEPETLAACFPEFRPYETACRFPDCAHLQEPDCGVREALENGQIRPERYAHYCRFYEELKERKKRRY